MFCINNQAKPTKISIVVPVYNEAAVLHETIKRLDDLCHRFIELEFELLFVDDGSRDESLTILRFLALSKKNIRYISLSRNFGHQIAVSCGIENASGDFIVIMDADLQDPPELIYEMYKLALNGQYDVVYGVRKKRLGESKFKKISAHMFYRLLNYLSDIQIPVDVGDFRLISKKVAGYLTSMPEKHRFIRGMIPWLGFKSCGYEYERERRFAGDTKYPLSKMISFSFTAILAFSTKPLVLVIKLGFLLFLLFFLGLIYLIYLKIFTNILVPGVVTIVLSIMGVGGIQLMVLGLIGLYISRIFDQVKNRPLYIIKEKSDF